MLLTANYSSSSSSTLWPRRFSTSASILHLLLLATAPSPAAAFWRLPCAAPVVVERADPIEQPGLVSRHAHTVMGSAAFDFRMDSNSTALAAQQQQSCSTCKAVEDGSNYWVPTLYYHDAANGSFAPVAQAGGALIYYLQRTDPRDPEYDAEKGGKGLLAFPEGFRMVAGTPTRRNKTMGGDERDGGGNIIQEPNPVSFACLGVDGPATPELPAHNCPGGMRAQLTFPSCWDGVRLDAPDHKSHMAYPSGLDTGFCPPSHPKRFITIFMEVLWNVDEFKDQWGGGGEGGGDGGKQRQPFVFSHGDPDGYGYHGDFLNGWDVPTLQRAIDTCTDDSGVIERCGALTLRSDDDMKACRVLPRVAEPYSGLLAVLPGCNPIQSGPEEAVPRPASDCPGVATEISADPVLPFTDLTQTQTNGGWRFAACARDPAGQERTLRGDSEARDDMTADGCVAFCGARGFRLAGVENGRECFCGGDGEITEDRRQKPGLFGNCDMFRCAGNATQFCGGYGEVGVYEKCDEGGGECRNMDLPGL
ncbi:hypothetical protein SLS62_009016 [Diatrype stigma]|uniref:WSC domain-containing protein n=1 Tax=Diatrype stigma TaxID=117547 RepID=A0AAN9YMD6_9PEZI